MTTRAWAAIMLSAFLLTSTNVSALFNLNNFVPNNGGLKVDPGRVAPTAPPAPRPLPPPASLPEEIPVAPGFWIHEKTTHSITFKFEDKSDIEAGFTLYRQRSDGDWLEIASIDSIENRSAELYIWDDEETGIRVTVPGLDEPVQIVPVSQSRLSNFWALNIGESDISENTRYCYRLVPYDGQGREPENVPTVCTTTNRDLKAGSNRGRVSRAANSVSTGVPVGVDEYDTAVMVNDRVGLVGELNAKWKGNKLVYVDNRATIDLSLQDTLPLKENLTLMSGRDKLVEGALLFNNIVQKKRVFEVKGNNVQVVGLRFRGPSASNAAELDKAEAVYVNIGKISRSLLPDIPLNILITSNEFYHWTGAGVSINNSKRAFTKPGSFLDSLTIGCRISDPIRSLALLGESLDDPATYGTYIDEELCVMTRHNAEGIRVTANYFHHNQRQNAGYGIVVAGYTYAYIDKNTFDYNRHAIASTGGRNVIDSAWYGPQNHGYKAYLNLVLPGHTGQCYSTAGITGEQVAVGTCAVQTHHFDVHGTDKETWYNDAAYGSGWAGEYFDVADNSFLSIKGAAFNVRGTPSQGASFRNNVLPAAQYYYAGNRVYYGWGSVLDNSDRDNIHVRRNRALSDARANIGVGDFDGDGVDDVFLATGASWYYSSGGRTEWRYLNKSRLRMDDLILFDYDSNGKADVLRERRGRWLVSEDGVTGWRRADHIDEDYINGQSNSGTSVTGDFTGDGNIDQLQFNWDGDRYFYVNGERHSRYQM